MTGLKTYLPHIAELRKRIISCLIGYLILLVPCIWQSGKLYQYLSWPIIKLLPEKTMIATQVLTPFTVPLKLALFTAFIGIVPFILYQAWAFVKPALYQNEKNTIAPLFTLSTVLFFAGMGFAHHVVAPLTLQFILMTAPPNVAIMPDIGSYLDFILSLYWVFGFAFQVPIITYVLIWANIITPEAIKQKRPYVILGAFTLGMLLTPPDVISQICLALPLWLLFELGVLLAKKLGQPLPLPE